MLDVVNTDEIEDKTTLDEVLLETATLEVEAIVETPEVKVDLPSVPVV